MLIPNREPWLTQFSSIEEIGGADLLTLAQCVGLDPRVDLAGADFSGTEFLDQDFSGCDLRECNFSGCRFVNVRFSEADLTDAIFTDCEGRNVEFNLARTVGCDFSTAKFSNVSGLRMSPDPYANKSPEEIWKSPWRFEDFFDVNVKGLQIWRDEINKKNKNIKKGSKIEQPPERELTTSNPSVNRIVAEIAVTTFGIIFLIYFDLGTIGKTLLIPTVIITSSALLIRVIIYILRNRRR